MTSTNAGGQAATRAPLAAGTGAPAMAAWRDPWVVATGLLLMAVTIVASATFGDYGITFDEPTQAVYGEHILAWYRSGFQDREVLEYRNMEFYGGLFDVVAQAAWRFSPFGQFETRHLVNALVGVAGLAAACRLATQLAGARAGFLAAAFLVLTPVWYGHAFNNPKDIPFAVLFLLALSFILEWVRALPRVPWSLVLKLGFAIGLTMAVRMGGILLFGYLGAAWLAWYVWRLRAGERPRGALPAFVLRGGAAFALAWVVMLPWWPAAMVRPFAHPIRTLGMLSNFDWNYDVFFAGRHIPATELPWTYLPTWFLLTLPEFVLLGVVAAAGFAVLALRRRPSPSATAHEARGEPGVRALQWGTLVFAFVFPASFAILAGSVLYDGLRHFLFAVPLLAIIAASGIDRLLAVGRAARLVTSVALLTLMSLTIVDMIRLHPHQYVWFNRAIAGGVANAARSYETDYWGNGYKEAVEWMNAHYGANPPERPYRVASCSQRLASEYYMRPDLFRYVGPNGDPELFLGSSRFRCVDRMEGRVVHEVGRMEATFVTVKEVGK